MVGRAVHRIATPDGKGLFCVARDSGIPGPRVAVTANVHGDETTGAGAVFKLDADLPALLRRGVVWLYPSLNPGGLEVKSRELPDDAQDVNRHFPGDPQGTPVQRHAHAIWADITARGPDALVDLHADSAVAVPYTIVDRPVALPAADRPGMSERLSRFARATGLMIVREYPDDQYIRYQLDRSLAGAMVNRAGVPAITIEVGPRRAIDPRAVPLVVRGVLGVLACLEMVDGDCLPPPAEEVGPWRRTATPRVKRAGLFVPALRPGEHFEAGAVLGDVHDLSGAVVDTLTARERGIVVSWADAAWVVAGAIVGTIGVADS